MIAQLVNPPAANRLALLDAISASIALLILLGVTIVVFKLGVVGYDLAEMLIFLDLIAIF